MPAENQTSPSNRRYFNKRSATCQRAGPVATLNTGDTLMRAPKREADTSDELRARVRDTVRRHFDDEVCPKAIRLHFVHDAVIVV